MARITFSNGKNDFFKSLKQKVDNYFAENNLDTAGNSKLYIKSLILILATVAIYVTLLFFTPPLLISIVLCCVLGMCFSAIGFNIMHEGGHSSFSRHPWINNIAAYSLNAMGGTTYFWKIKHNISHHTFTNIDGHDPDIDVKPFMRLHADHPKYWIHRFQHLYWIVLYGISYFMWVFYQDFEKYFSGKIAPQGGPKKLESKEHFIFWGTKLAYVSIYILIPILAVGFVPFIIGFAITSFVCGLFISVVFQMAHMVEATQFPEPNESSNKIEQEWAIHQVETTANFATRNKLVSWLLGGLNFQVEHHLFPRISHIHYPQINVLVKETCAEYNVNYSEYPTVRQAFRSHLVHIKRMGTL